MEDRVLIHHGIEGQKWGRRRWQNPDGSLTPEGRIHYGYGNSKEARARRKEFRKEARSETKEQRHDVVRQVLLGNTINQGYKWIRSYNQMKASEISEKEYKDVARNAAITMFLGSPVAGIVEYVGKKGEIRGNKKLSDADRKAQTRDARNNMLRRVIVGDTINSAWNYRKGYKKAFEKARYKD